MSDRLARWLYLATLALVPWSALVPFPWLHENARWSDAIFALAFLAWGAGLARARPLPRLRPVHAGLALYLGWAAVSLLVAAPRSPSGPAKLLGLGMLLALFVVTSEMAERPGMPAAIGRTIAATSLLTALAALAGVALSAFGTITPLVGTCGDLFPGPLSRAQAGFPRGPTASWRRRCGAFTATSPTTAPTSSPRRRAGASTSRSRKTSSRRWSASSATAGCRTRRRWRRSCPRCVLSRAAACTRCTTRWPGWTTRRRSTAASWRNAGSANWRATSSRSGC